MLIALDGDSLCYRFGQLNFHRLNLTSLYAQNSKRAGDAAFRQPIIDSANSGQTDALVPLSPIWADCTPLLCPQR